MPIRTRPTSRAIPSSTDHVDLEHRAIPIRRALAGEPDTDVVLKPGDVLTIGQSAAGTILAAPSA